jgi:hypothetical protein
LVDLVEEFGELYAGFVVPSHLVFCDRETLFKFPYREPSRGTLSSLFQLCSEDEVLETQVRMTVGVGSRKERFKADLSSYFEQADDRFSLFGMSIAAILDLALVLDCERPLLCLNSSRIHAEQMYFMSKQFVASILAIEPDDIDGVCEAWRARIRETYSDEPIDDFGRSQKRHWYLHGTEYQVSHLTLEFLADFVENLLDICSASDRRRAVFISTSL